MLIFRIVFPRSFSHQAERKWKTATALPSVQWEKKPQKKNKTRKEKRIVSNFNWFVLETHRLRARSLNQVNRELRNAPSIYSIVINKTRAFFHAFLVAIDVSTQISRQVNSQNSTHRLLIHLVWYDKWSDTRVQCILISGTMQKVRGCTRGN